MSFRPVVPKTPLRAEQSAGRGAAARRVWPILVLGFAPPLAVLAGVAAAAIGRAGETPAALVWAVAPAAVAALLTAASAAWTLVALRRAWKATATPPQVEPGASARLRDDDAAAMEIDHKVRNALQIVESLISLELRRAGPSGERAALLRVQARLHSLSLVHRRHSALDASASVRLDLIIAEIADHVFADHGLSGRAPDAEAVEAHVTLDAVSAAPERAAAFALFVNEALMNAREHLDRGPAAGPVRVSLSALDGGACLLSIRNATCATVDAVAEDGAVGVRLMTNCAEQLGARLSTGRSGGWFEVRLEMPAEPPA